MNEEKKMILIANVQQAVLDDPDFAEVILSIALDSLKEVRQNLNRKSSALNTIAMNIKPEYIEELQKILIPEFFERAGVKLKP